MQVSIGCTAVFLIGGPTKHTEPLPIIVLSTTPLHSAPLAEYCRTAKLPDLDCLFSLSAFAFSLGLAKPMSIVVFLAARRRRRHHGGRSAPLLERYSSLHIESQPCGMPSGSPLLGNGANRSYSCTIEPYCRAYDWRTADRLVLRRCSHMHLATGQPLACRQPTLFPWTLPAINTLCERQSALVVPRMPT
jgi:hypothetical protein